MSAEPCARCGRAHVTRTGAPACAGHSKAGRACHNPPMTGQRVCRLHGGGAPQNRRAAARRVAEERAAQAVATLGLPVDVSPTEALLEEVRWTAGHVQWLRGKVAELEDDRQLVWGVTRAETEAGASLRIDIEDGAVAGVSSAPATKVVQTSGPSVWYELYARERQHLVAVCTAALKAGVEERRVRLAESQGELVALVIRRILDAMYTALLGAGFTDTQVQAVWAAAVADIVPRELRALTGSPT